MGNEFDDLHGEFRDWHAQMRRNFRLLFGGIVIKGIGVAVLLAKSFDWL
jgi:hypothetical protein